MFWISCVLRLYLCNSVPTNFQFFCCFCVVLNFLISFLLIYGRFSASLCFVSLLFKCSMVWNFFFYLDCFLSVLTCYFFFIVQLLYKIFSHPHIWPFIAFIFSHSHHILLFFACFILSDIKYVRLQGISKNIPKL